MAASWPLLIQLSLWRGQVSLENRAHQRALSWLKVASFLNPHNAEVHFLLARTYRRLRRFDDVSRQLDQARKLGWDVALLKREQLIALAQTGQYAELKGHWSELFDTAGSDGPEISNAYVSGCISRLRLADALRVLNAWQADYPTDSQSYFLRGRLHEATLNWSDAARAYQQALQLAPSRIDARFHLAKSLMKLGRFQNAESHLRQVLREAPRHHKAPVVLATCLIKLRKTAEARDLLTLVLQKTPNRLEALKAMGKLELSAGRPKAALRYLKPAAKRHPEDCEVRYAYGKALRETGDEQAAREQFAFVDAAAKPLLQLKQLTKKLLKNPRNTEIRFQIATLTWKYKSHDEGAQWFLSLLAIDPNHKPTHAALARHYALLGDDKQAELHRRLAR